MEIVKDIQTIKNDNDFQIFDDYIENIDLNSDIEKIYEIINDDGLQEEFEKQVKLTKLRDENHKRYHSIETLKYNDLPHDLDDVIDNIISLYECINSNEILSDNFEDSINTKTILDNIYRRIDRLNSMTKSYLKEITKRNDEKQSKFSMTYFNNLNINENLKKELIEKYNDLVLYSSFITQDIYEDLKRQIKRETYISEIFGLLNIEEENKLRIEKKDRLAVLNKQIDIAILDYKQQIQYLEDIIPEKSKHIEEFNDFKEFFNKIIAYDDNSYDNAKQTYEILSDELKFKTYISNFEELFIQEKIDKQNEEKFIFEKVGIKNLRTSLNYITANYMNDLDEESKKIIEYIFNNLNNKDYDLEELNKALKLVVRNIWSQTITDVYSFNPNKDYYFICSNNQFIDEKYQTILISKKELNRVDDYHDYQIGFICEYNDNIMYITENDDIMTVDNDDMSNLKTPIQLEQEFMNFRVCNRIALDGYKTKIQAVYYIDDGNVEKYMKAIELANMYKLPLIKLKKDNN